jgi:hypothetical protein
MSVFDLRGVERTDFVTVPSIAKRKLEPGNILSNADQDFELEGPKIPT